MSDQPRLEPVPEDWSRALAVVAHPDDLEYGAASAIARWSDQGKEIVYVMVTDGEAGIDSMSPEEAGPLRRDEQIRSAAEVGVDVVEFLGLPDGLVEADHRLRRAIAAQIRTHRPDVLIGLNFRETFGFPSWNHVDHRNVGVGLLDASRDAGNRWLFPDLLDEGLEPWAGVRFAAFANSPQGDHAVDVTSSLDRGIASLEQHRVYLDSLPAGTLGTDPDAMLRGRAAEIGPLAGVRYAVRFEVIPL